MTVNRRWFVKGVSALAASALGGTANAQPGSALGNFWWEVPPQGRTVLVLDYTSPEWREAISDAAARWNEQLLALEDVRRPFLAVEHRNTEIWDGDALQIASEERAIVIVSPTLNAAWNGSTSPFPQGALTGAVISFDNADYLDPVTGQPILLYPEFLPRRELACHELGHALGASHSPSETGCGCMAEDRLICTDALGQDGASQWTLDELQGIYAAAQSSSASPRLRSRPKRDRHRARRS